MATNMDNVVFDKFNAYVPEQLLNQLEILLHDSNDDSEDNSDYAVEENAAVVSHKFLAVIAPIDGEPETRATRDEVNKRKQEFLDFLKTHYKDNAKIDKDIQGVSGFPEFEEKLGSFFKGLHANDLAIVFFLGHGSDVGALCFNKGNTSCKEALTRIQTCFHKNRPKEMPAHQCRVVFAQCHAHHVDERNESGVVHAADGEDGIEYIYFTCNLKPKTHTRELASEDTFLTLQHDLIDKDVYVKPPKRLVIDVIRMKQLADFKRNMRATITASQYEQHQAHVAKYLLNGPPEDLPQSLFTDVENWRKKRSMFLQIVVQQDESSSDPDFSVFDQHTDSEFTVKQKVVWSEAQFHKEVLGFLSGSAEGIILPVILVKGEYVEAADSCNRKLVFSDQPEGVAVYDLFRKYINAETSQRRMLFMGRLGHAGNTVPPPYRNDELHDKDNASALLGDGPKNKFGPGPALD